MRYYILRRLLFLAPVLFGLTLMTFTISHIFPSDPVHAWLGEYASQQAIDQYRATYHLNDPIIVQYYYYLVGLIHGDLGTSPMSGRPVIEDLVEYFPATVELTSVALLLSIGVGIVVGVLSATHRNKPADHASRISSLISSSMPNFWVGLMLQFVFYFSLGWLPAGGRISGPPPAHITGLYLVDSLLTFNFSAFTDALTHIILPAIMLSLWSMALFIRLVRSSMLDVLGQDFITTATSKGLPRRIVIYKHALRNALTPTVTMVGYVFGGQLGGAVVTESIFNWPGIGRYAVLTAVSYLDFPAIMGVTLLCGAAFILVNLLVDLVYAYVDPRIKVA